MDALVRTQSGRFTGEVRLRLLRRLRQTLIKRLHDPLISYTLGDISLALPTSHNLPITRARLPNYSLNVGRIAKHIQAKYPELAIVDIGANVGDTVAILRSQCNSPILCIDGNARFYSLLELNTAKLKDIYLEKAFVGFATGTVKGHVSTGKGTAHVVFDDTSNESVYMKALPDILEGHPIFLETKLVKIDTDGFDVSIVIDNLPLWRKARPVLFLEYMPAPFTAERPQELEVFEKLRTAGYQMALVYEETGEYAFSVDLQHTQTLEDLFRFYAGRRDKRYCDLAIFHAEDADLCQTIRCAELDYFRQYRAQSRT